jgi:hypothetical protein
MSSSDAQRSPVHHATEDSNVEPSGPVARDSNPTRAGSGADSEAAPGRVERQASELKKRPNDAMGVPGSFERGAATAGRAPDTDANPPAATGIIGGGPGAGDASSGGGAGAGIPGGGTDMRTNGAFSGGDPDQDRERLFPDAPPAARQRRPGDEADPTDPDPSSFGGPLDLDDPGAV